MQRNYWATSRSGWIMRTLFCRTAAPIAILAFSALVATPQVSLADEGGVSFWLPGIFGSLAAVPQQPGWALSTVYYHTNVSAGGNVALGREFEIGRIPGNVSATLNARSPCHRRSRSADADLHLRDTGSGGPSLGRIDGNLWSHQQQPGWHIDGHHRTPTTASCAVHTLR